MAGVISYSVYLPNYLLTGEVIGKAWGRPHLKGCRTVANYDEDSLTMAVAASLTCLRNGEGVRADGIFFSSTTPTYAEKMNSSVIAAAIDLKESALTMDITCSLRSSTSALRSALDTISSGSRENILVVASDTRLGGPGSNLEPYLGDGASAFLVGKKRSIAEVVDFFSVYDGFPDVWRRANERFLRQDDVRYSRTENYAKKMASAIEGLLSSGNYQKDDFSKVVLFPQDPRSHAHLAKELGFAPEQIQDNFIERTGLIGSAHIFMMLAFALEEAKPNDLILLANYGDGADAFVIKVTEHVNEIKKQTRAEMERKRRILGSYTHYLKFKNLVGDYEIKTPFSALPLLRREEDLVTRLHGKRCNSCGRILTLSLMVCPHCKSAKNFSDIKLSRKGKVVTYSQEYYYPAPESPVTMAVVDLEGGGRILAQMTDVQAEEVRVDMPVELIFRKLHTGGGFVNYCWKCRPVQGGEE